MVVPSEIFVLGTTEQLYEIEISVFAFISFSAIVALKEIKAKTELSISYNCSLVNLTSSRQKFGFSSTVVVPISKKFIVLLACLVSVSSGYISKIV